MSKRIPKRLESAAEVLRDLQDETRDAADLTVSLLRNELELERQMSAKLRAELETAQKERDDARTQTERWSQFLHEAQNELAAAKRDGERMDWLQAHPLPTEVLRGPNDGEQGHAWAIACANSISLREAIDAAMSKEKGGA